MYLYRDIFNAFFTHIFILEVKKGKENKVKNVQLPAVTHSQSYPQKNFTQRKEQTGQLPGFQFIRNVSI